MLDVHLIRANPQLIKDNLKKKNQNDKLKDVDKFIELDKEWRSLKQQIDQLRNKRNTISLEINELIKQKKDAASKIKEVKAIPEKIKQIEAKAEKLNLEIEKSLSSFPNIIHKSVPIGKSEKDNKVLRTIGKIPKFAFPVKTHVELIENLKIADFEASARVAGKGFYYLKNELAILNQALIRFAIDFMRKKRYEYIETPLMLNEESIYASMDKAAIEQSVYSIKDENLNLIGTAEQSLLAMHANDVFLEEKLPKKYFSYSMCFRKEIGAHGINEKGLWRTHQFNKVEQFIFCKPEDSYLYYEELLKNTEQIMQKLKLPYRVVEFCSADLASWKSKSCDIEVYRPTLKEYGEIASLSNCTDYQARKLNIKLVRKDNTREVVHTLNNTALATSRTMVAILENYQRKDGSIKVPAVLVPYTGFKKIPSE